MSEFWAEFLTEENASGQGDSDNEPNPFVPFESGVGKPSLRQGYLVNRRDHIVCLIEPHWHELEWNLRRARTPEQIHAAFQIEAFKVNPGPLAPLVRHKAETAMLKALEATRKERADAAEFSGTLWNKYQEQLRVYEEIRRLASQFSEAFEEHLQCDLARRTENVRRLKTDAANLRQAIREHQLEHKTRITATPEQAAELAAFTKDKEVLESQAADEEKTCEGIKSRLQAITLDARKLANEEETRQKSVLGALETDWKRADARYRAIDETFQEQEAFVFGKQVLNFVKEREYTLNPLHLASAIAGLPYITARRSAQRCARIPCQIAKSQAYELFEFVTDVWEQYRKRESRRSLPDAFEAAIRAYPKFKIIDHHKKANLFRAYLAEHWYYLKRALDRNELSQVDTRAVPGEIVTRFLKRLRNPDSPLTAILAKLEQVVD